MQPAELIASIRAGDRRALGRAVTVFEDARPLAVHKRRELLSACDAQNLPPRAHVVGITGTPGAGKSTLIDSLISQLLRDSPHRTIAVIAVDPSSAQSGGSILGDRTRIQGARTSQRVFFRSQASSLALGGLSRTTFAVCRLLERLFDLVLLETVGVGQNEIEVCHVAHHTWLVMPPLGGDHIQWMKAGIMEIPDVLILNKSDQSELARRSYHSLRSALALAQPGFRSVPPIIRTSALTGSGVDELVTWLSDNSAKQDAAERQSRSRYFFQRWLVDEYGRAGWRQFEQQPDYSNVMALASEDFEGAQAKVTTALA